MHLCIRMTRPCATAIWCGLYSDASVFVLFIETPKFNLAFVLTIDELTLMFVSPCHFAF